MFRRDNRVLMMLPAFYELGLALCLVLPRTSAAASSALETGDSRNFERYFEAGTEAYLDNDWNSCVVNLEKASQTFDAVRRGQARCRTKCQNAVDKSGTDDTQTSSTEPLSPGAGGFDTLQTRNFYQKVVGIALCLMQCEKEVDDPDDKGPPGKERSHQIELDFAQKVPYDYMQLCYFKIGNNQKAASCAYTFLIHNPDHDVMRNNLKYYLDLPDVSFDRVEYLEARNYQKLYFEATKAYGQGNYGLVIEKMEESIKEYFVAEEECRALCEGSLPSSPRTSFVVSIAHHYTFTLRCKVNCPYELSLGHGDVQRDALPSYFHYLQFSYYRTGDVKKACEAVASFLYLRTNDTVMLENRLFYETLDEVGPEFFTPRNEVVEYAHRYQQENKFLSYIDKAFDFANENGNHIPKSVDDGLQHSNSSSSAKNNQQAVAHQWAADSGIHLTMNEVQLKGTKRFVVDNLSSKDECDQLVHLASEGATHGDGYNGKLSPHTEFETFEGLTVGRAVTLAHKGLIDPLEAQLFLNASEKARKYVEIYFNLTSTLYFAYTHLVCRTALNDKIESRNDLSHPVHADNCLLTKDGECLKQRPAYTWRDYSAILYLNDDFDGGEFIFAKSKDAIEATVKPTCGRMVGFSAGKENLHGVQAVVKGRRCALAMWYTLDARHLEKERTIAEQAIAQLVKNKIELQSVPNLSPPLNGHLPKPPKESAHVSPPPNLHHPSHSHVDF